MDVICEGIVLKETFYGEKDKIVTFLTDKLGKITVYAKGVRDITSKNSHGVQLFCHSGFDMIEKNGRYTLRTAVAINSFYTVRDNLEGISLASYFADVASTVCSENNNESEMLRLMLNCFYAISSYTDIPFEIIKATFEMKCMQINGFAPDLSCCMECGKPRPEKATDDTQYKFIFSEGGLLCKSCAEMQENNDYFYISQDTINTINYILNSPQSKMMKYNITEQHKNEFLLFCEKYLCYQTSKRYETLSFYKNVMSLK